MKWARARERQTERKTQFIFNCTQYAQCSCSAYYTHHTLTIPRIYAQTNGVHYFFFFRFFFSKFPTHKLYEYYSNWYGGCVVSTILAVDSALMSSKIEFIMPFETRSFSFLFSRSFHERRSVLFVMLSEVTRTSLNQP